MTALLAAIAAGAVVVTATVDIAKHLFKNVLKKTGKTARLYGVVWTSAGFVVGVVYCIGWQLNLAPQAMKLIPALASSTRLSGVGGQFITGLVIGAFSRFGHEILDALSKRNP